VRRALRRRSFVCKDSLHVGACVAGATCRERFLNHFLFCARHLSNRCNFLMSLHRRLLLVAFLPLHPLLQCRSIRLDTAWSPSCAPCVSPCPCYELAATICADASSICANVCFQLPSLFFCVLSVTFITLGLVAPSSLIVLQRRHRIASRLSCPHTPLPCTLCCRTDI
jgi:hypothetical protein